MAEPRGDHNRCDHNRSDDDQREYTHGHHDSVLRSHRWRTAENSAGYLLGHLRPGLSLLDVVYAPWPTPFAATAAGAGARVVSGLEMLLHQAVAQVELMTGHPGPVLSLIHI